METGCGKWGDKRGKEKERRVKGKVGGKGK